MEASYSVISPLLFFDPVSQVAESFKKFPGRLTFPMLDHVRSDRDDQFGLGRGFCLAGSKNRSQDGHILQVRNTSMLICRGSLYNASDDHG